MDEYIARFFSDLFARASGPMHIRLFLQPLMALIFATRAGVRDARLGQPPYFWTIFNEPDHRRELLRSGWKDVGKVFVLAIVLDVVYQLVAVRWVYPLESLVMAILLAFVPYLLCRGAITRLVQRIGAHARRSRRRGAV